MAQIEVSKLEKLDLLRVCQARIFLDIWRMDDLNKVWDMMMIMERTLQGAPDRSDTPQFNRLVDKIRHSSEPLSDLEKSSATALAMIDFADMLKRRRAARSATT